MEAQKWIVGKQYPIIPGELFYMRSPCIVILVVTNGRLADARRHTVGHRRMVTRSASARQGVGCRLWPGRHAAMCVYECMHVYMGVCKGVARETRSQSAGQGSG